MYHFLRRISNEILHVDQTEITLVDGEIGDCYEIEVLKANMDCMEKYIGHGWYEYAKENKLRVGVVLCFMICDHLKMLYVTVKRR